MHKTLEYFMNKVPDWRSNHGTMYPAGSLLMMMILANMSGWHGYREMAKYMESNEEYFTKKFNLKHGVPKHVSLRTFIMNLDFDELLSCFRLWCNQFVNLEVGDVVSLDGKGLNSTVENCHNSLQNYKSMVSMFCEKTGVVVDAELIEMKKSHEIGAAQLLIGRLGSKGVLITADALHCQKKRLEQL